MSGRGPLGVIGGMGPFASAHFYRRLTELQRETSEFNAEQDYADVIIYSKPSIPDRTVYITGKSADDPFFSLLEAARVLENAGCGVIAIPCVTAHFFYDRLSRELRIPLLNIVEETVSVITESGVRKAGLLATNGTVAGRMFHKHLEKHGIETVTLPPTGQEYLMDWIYNKAKHGGTPETETPSRLSEELFGLGAEVIILGCTELSLSGTDWRTKHVDALDELARAALKYFNEHKGDDRIAD